MSAGRSGQSTVEFAISAVVLILLVLGLIDFGRAFYFGIGLTSAAREGARQASWFDDATGTNPYLYDQAIKDVVDRNLKNSGLQASVLGNATGTSCPSTSDGNSLHNPPYAGSAYSMNPGSPILYICYADDPGLDLTAPPIDNRYRGSDVTVIVVMDFGFATTFLQGVLGNAFHMAGYAHMAVGGWPSE